MSSFIESLLSVSDAHLDQLEKHGAYVSVRMLRELRNAARSASDHKAGAPVRSIPQPKPSKIERG